LKSGWNAFCHGTTHGTLF